MRDITVKTTEYLDNGDLVIVSVVEGNGVGLLSDLSTADPAWTLYLRESKRLKITTRVALIPNDANVQGDLRHQVDREYNRAWAVHTQRVNHVLDLLALRVEAHEYCAERLNGNVGIARYRIENGRCVLVN